MQAAVSAADINHGVNKMLGPLIAIAFGVFMIAVAGFAGSRVSHQDFCDDQDVGDIDLG